MQPSTEDSAEREHLLPTQQPQPDNSTTMRPEGREGDGPAKIIALVRLLPLARKAGGLTALSRLPLGFVHLNNALLSIVFDVSKFFTVATWVKVLINDPIEQFGWFALHPPLQSLTIFLFTYGELS